MLRHQCFRTSLTGLAFAALVLSSGVTSEPRAPKGVVLPKDVIRHLDCGSVADSLVFSPDGSLLAAQALEKTTYLIRCCDVATGKRREDLPGIRYQYGYNFAFSADGKALFQASDDGVAVWELSVDSRRLLSKEAAEHLAASPIAPIVAIGNNRDRAVEFWDWKSGELKELRARWGAGGLYSLAYSPDGRLLAGGIEGRGMGLGGAVCVWSAATGRLLGTLVGRDEQRPIRDRPVNIVAFSADGRLIAGATSRPFTRMRPLRDSDPVFQRRGEHARIRPENLIRVWEVSSGQEIFSIVREEAWADCLAFSPRGWLLATACSDGLHDIDLWDARTGERIHRFTTPEEVLVGPVAAFTPDGDALATAVFTPESTVQTSANSGGCLLWDVRTYQRPLPEGAPLPPAALERLWTDLASEKVSVARHALRRLACSPKDSVPFLGRHLRPAATPDPKRLAALITDLDSQDFKTRERATAELEKAGEQAAAALHGALRDGAPSPEVRRRLVDILACIERRPISSSDTLRTLRALEALEWVGSKGAIDILRRMADGAAGAVETEDARAALQRLDRAAHR